MKSHFLLFTIILAGLQGVSQSLVVISLESDKITVGSDSKSVRYYTESLPGGKKRYYKNDTIICKIHKQGNIYFTITGYEIDHGVELARQCISYSRNLSGAATLYYDKRKKHLVNYINNVKKDKSLTKQLKGTLNATKIAFFGFEDGVSRVTILDYITDTTSNEAKVKIEKLEKFMLPGTHSVNVQMMGHKNYASKLLYLKTRGENGRRSDITAQIKSQVKGTPETVGLPIVILEVTKRGETWYPAKNPCR